MAYLFRGPACLGPEPQPYQSQPIDWRQLSQDIGLWLGIAVSIGTLIRWSEK